MWAPERGEDSRCGPHFLLMSAHELEGEQKTTRQRDGLWGPHAPPTPHSGRLLDGPSVHVDFCGPRLPFDDKVHPMNGGKMGPQERGWKL